MAEWVLTGSRYTYRDKDNDNALVVLKRGDKVELNEEQAKRHRAGEPGSPFQREVAESEEDLVEIAVANEATKPAKEDGFQASPEQTRNRRIPASRVDAGVASQREEPRQRADAEDEVPEPVTTTASKSTAGKAQK